MKKTIKIFGIGAVVMLAFLTISPLCTVQASDTDSAVISGMGAVGHYGFGSTTMEGAAIVYHVAEMGPDIARIYIMTVYRTRFIEDIDRSWGSG